MNRSEGASAVREEKLKLEEIQQNMLYVFYFIHFHALFKY